MKKRVIIAVLFSLVLISCQSKPTPPASSSCQSVSPRDKMIQVGVWCVDKYEASIWEHPDGSGRQFFFDSTNSDRDFYVPEAANTPEEFHRDGSGQSQVYALSIEGVIPARGVTWYQASVACANSGKVLIPDAIWQLAAVGTFDPGNEKEAGTGGLQGGSEQDGPGARCNIASHGNFHDMDHNGRWLDDRYKVRPTGRAGKTFQGRDSCVSRFGVQDMVGNLWEWTDQNGIPAGGVPQFVQASVNSSGGPFDFSDGTWNVNSTAYGCKGSGKKTGACDWWKNALNAPLRGGSWFDKEAAGVTAVYYHHSGAHSGWNIGFRCARLK